MHDEFECHIMGREVFRYHDKDVESYVLLLLYIQKVQARFGGSLHQLKEYIEMQRRSRNRESLFAAVTFHLH
jgi:hypothetical protein